MGRERPAVPGDRPSSVCRTVSRASLHQAPGHLTCRASGKWGFMGRAYREQPLTVSDIAMGVFLGIMTAVLFVAVAGFFVLAVGLRLVAR